MFGLLSCVSADGDSKTIEMMDKTDAKIYAEIEKAVGKVDKENADLDKIIEALIEKTEKIADKMVEKAAKDGVLVEKTYIEVEIGGRIVLVDPLRVVGN